MWSITKKIGVGTALAAMAGLAISASAQTIHPEIEPNDNKTEALFNGPFTLASGDGITGQSQGSTTSGGGIATRDYFLIRTPSASPGIYRHRLELTVDSGTIHSTVNIRGLSQSSGVINPSSDVSIQSSTSLTGPTRRINA
jgi:hypothetical protein